MKKQFVLFTLILILSSTCFAKIAGSRFKITESEEEFDLLYIVTEDMTVAENLDNNDVAVTKTFTINKNGLAGEVRYSLFTDIGEDDSNLQIQYFMWVFMCMNNIAGFEVPGNAIANFNNNDVKKEFNGDFGCTAFLQDPKSEYSNGYKYMMVEFFYKAHQGLVMRTFLFNDIEFVGINAEGALSPDSPWFSNYHIFRFMEKDENGKYIVE